MFELLIYGVIIWVIMKIVLSGMIDSSLDEAPPHDIKEHIAQDKPPVVVIRMEQIKGWWYGFYASKGGDIFVAQGTTFEEAVDNCKDRLQSDALKDNQIKLAFTELKK
jgi:hypothetical protein